MIKKNQRYFNWINRLLDMGIIFVSYLAAVWFWFYFLENDRGNIAVQFAVQNQLPVLLVSFGFTVVFQYGGMYDSLRFRSIWSELMQLLKCMLLCVVLTVGGIFILKLSGFSRGVVVSFAVAAYTGLCFKRVVLRLLLRQMRRQGYNQKHMLIIGTGALAEKYLACIKANPHYGCQCIGYVGDKVNPALGKILGTYDEVESVLERYEPDEAIIAIEQHEMNLINAVIATCEEQGIRASIIPIYNDFLPSTATVDVIGNVRLINMRANAQDVIFNRAIKRCFDIVLSLAAIVLTSPVQLVVAVGVWLSSPGPVLFRQERVGRDRKPFILYKFRSMRLNEASDTAWSRDRDSRVTRFGAWIRKFSLDELPQFYNVLRGDMSVVGPRPELPHFVEQYKYEIRRYMVKHQVKPGITGWAQVKGYRGDTSIEKRVELDLWYIENWSMGLDIKIILMTIFSGMMNQEKNISREKEESVV